MRSSTSSPRRYNALLAEQEAGICVVHVLVGEDGTVLGRFNLVDLEDGTWPSSDTGSRSKSRVAAWRPRPCENCVGSRPRGTGCACSEQPKHDAVPQGAGDGRVVVAVSQDQARLDVREVGQVAAGGVGLELGERHEMRREPVLEPRVVD